MTRSPWIRWNQSETDMLCDMVSEEQSFGKIAKHIGRTRNACIGQFTRIRRKYGEQAL